MQNSGSLSQNPSLRLTPQQSLRRLGLCSQISTSQHCSPVVFPEKRSKAKASKRSELNPTSDDSHKSNGDEHRIEIGDEQSDLLGYDVYSGKLVLDKRKSNKSSDVQSSTEAKTHNAVDAKLTSKALVWGSNTLYLEDVISVSYSTGLRYFTVHSYPIKSPSCALSCFIKPKRSRKDFRFLAPSSDEAFQWVSGFADQNCFINCLPHPLVSSKKQASDFLPSDDPFEPHIRSKTPPQMLVILNPRSGRGRSTKVFHTVVEPIFKLAGFKLEVVKTKSAGHAKELAATVDFSTCPDGIVCVGGDGIVNEVLNGLLTRSNQKEAISIPIGIIPAGSDNSLVWTVLGVKDPASAAITIVKGGLTATDVFAVEWIKTGAIHFGMTVSYFGFVSDVLELSEKYQKRFGPLRYFVAGVLKFLCLPKYSYEVEYCPVTRGGAACDEIKALADKEVVDMSDLYTDVMRRSSKERFPRASSLSSIDSIMSPSRRMSVNEMDTTCSASMEPSEYVRGIDAKSKRLSSSGRRNDSLEPEVVHPSTTSNWPRTRSKSRTIDKGWAYDKEDISSTISDPGPIWDSEPKWDSEPNWDVENPVELPVAVEELDEGVAMEQRQVVVSPNDDMAEKLVMANGPFLGVLVCNHACRTVQSLSSQVVAPKAEPDDNTLDLLMVRGSGRLRLLRFFLLLQFGRHLTLPYVEYVKVKSVKIKPGKHTHDGCGIDGELFQVHGQVITSSLPEQCRLIGRRPTRQI